MSSALNTGEIDSNGAEGARRASLIATFFGPRAGPSPPPHLAVLYRCLADAPDADDIPDDWTNPIHGSFLRRFDPASRDARDTTVVQLALNARGPTAAAWAGMRDRLAACLVGTAVESIWGYTLIYEAATPTGVDPDLAFEDWRPAAQSLGSSLSWGPLARADVPGGRLWLLDIPVTGDGLAAAMVYVALGPGEHEETLVDFLYGPGAPLLMPDLVAHKGYYEMRGYQIGNAGDLLEQRTKALQTASERLREARGTDLPGEEQLSQVDRSYDALARVVPPLNDARISMLKQIDNLDSWRSAVGDNAVVSYHRRHLQTFLRELELRGESLRGTLDPAREVIAVAQVRVARALAERIRRAEEDRIAAERVHERRQQRIQHLLALVALGLAVPTLIDQRAAAELLSYRWHPTRSVTPPALEDGYNPWLLIGVRSLLVVAILLLVVLVWVAIRGLLRWYRPADERGTGTTP